MIHQFPLDPRSVLGIGPDASLEDADRAFRAKSMKHHPDHGGDEWAFRIVVRAHEILKSSADPRADHESVLGREDAPPGWDRPEPRSHDVHVTRAELRTVDIELIWLRFEFTTPETALPEPEPGDKTLSVCMAISWPRSALVARAAQHPEAAAFLRDVIQAFERLRSQEAILASRSRIEDGQFVGWLSYPDVVRAMLGFEAFREDLSLRRFQVKLRTRDEWIPQDWRDR
jgi:hypothetical protein